MVACVAALAQLAFLEIGFESPASRPDQGTRRPPPPTRAVSEYLEDLIARIDAPLLDDVKILFFNQLIFDIQRLAQFISHAPAEITFHSHSVVIMLSSSFKFLQLII